MSDISVKPGIVENIHNGVTYSPEEIKIQLFKEFLDIFAWSYKEIPSIGPSIMVHEFLTYPSAKPVQKQLLPMDPQKAAAIKAEVENLLQACFIYPTPLMNWGIQYRPCCQKGGHGTCLC